LFDAHLQAVIAEQPYPLLSIALSGAHLYGFPSSDAEPDGPAIDDKNALNDLLIRLRLRYS